MAKSHLRETLWTFRHQFAARFVAPLEHRFLKRWTNLVGGDPVAYVMRRDNLPRLLSDLGLTGIGVELGVSQGEYSHQILAASQLKHLYSVDRWAGDRGHDDHQMQEAAALLARFGDRSILLRATFEEALEKFDDDSLDFVYVDGYAGTGNEDGETFLKWWPKVRMRGIFSGHDYHPDFDCNVRAVENFARQVGHSFYLTKKDRLASWIIRKGDCARGSLGEQGRVALDSRA